MGDGDAQGVPLVGVVYLCDLGDRFFQVLKLCGGQCDAPGLAVIVASEHGGPVWEGGGVALHGDALGLGQLVGVDGHGAARFYYAFMYII